MIGGIRSRVVNPRDVPWGLSPSLYRPMYPSLSHVKCGDLGTSQGRGDCVGYTCMRIYARMYMYIGRELLSLTVLEHGDGVYIAPPYVSVFEALGQLSHTPFAQCIPIVQYY